MLVDGTGSIAAFAAGSSAAARRGRRVRVVQPGPPALRSGAGASTSARHRKIVVCDGRVGFTGGMNITDVHSAELSKDYWRDTHLRLTGAAVWPIQRLFFEDWDFAAEELPPIDERDRAAAARGPATTLVQIVASGPDTSSALDPQGVLHRDQPGDARGCG